jgi:diacylglycerol kinase family enzyme
VRALLVVNPAATSTSERARDVLVHALAAELELDVDETGWRGHAAELARQATASGVELIIALGGDGTANEVVNGLLGDGPFDPAVPHPAFAVVPGGSTNVLARSLGLPTDPVEATGQLLDALRHKRTRAIGLGRANGRWLTFCAGLGLDAEVIASVEDARAEGRRSTHSLYLRTVVRQFYQETDREQPALTLTRPGEPDETGLYLAIVANTAPWTFFGRLAVNPCPDASFDSGLDLMALRRLRTFSTLRHARQLLWPNGRAPRGRDVVGLHDLAEFTLWASRPTAWQLDGDHLGERMSVTFTSVPEALRVYV